MNNYMLVQETAVRGTMTKNTILDSIDRLIGTNAEQITDPELLQNELAALRCEIERINSAADFVLHNPAPILRISEAGFITMQNAAAAEIKYLVAGNKKVCAEEYWLKLAKMQVKPVDIVNNPDNGQAFLFKAVPDTSGSHVNISGCIITNSEQYRSNTVNEAISSTFLNDLIENLHDGILIEDKYNKLMLANNKLCSLFSYPHDAAALRGVHCWRITKNAIKLFKDPAGFLQRTKTLIRENVHTINDVIELVDGRVFKRDFIPLIDHEGESMGSMWVYNDITQVYASEKAIKEQRLFYEGIVSNLPIDIAVLNAEGRYTFVSNRTVKDDTVRKWMIGKTDLEYCTFRNLGLQFAENRQRRLQAVLNNRETEKWEEERLDEKGNVQVHLRVLNPVFDEDGGISQLFGYGINISERKQIEEQVRLSEKRYRELFHLSPGIILTHDIDGVLTSINPAIEKLLGYKAEKAIGCRLTDFLPEKDKPLFTAYIARVKQLDNTEGVFRIYNRQGKKVYLLYKNAIVKEEGNKPYVIAFAQDITERIMAEKELELARMATEESSKAKERFLANMSHEIRTPMNGIIGIANLLNKTRLDEQQENYLSLILESANNLIVIINDILDLEKIIAGKLEFESIPFNLSEKVQHIAESFFYKAEEKEIRLSINNSVPASLHLLGDPYRLSQILMNLISNAVKFTTRGEVSINVTYELENQDQVTVHIQVTDTGIGISPDKLSAIFDPYTQERSEISRKYGGTGLGLAITKNLVDMQGGVMHVQSTPGKGSSFSVSLPYVTTQKPVEKINLPGSFNLLRGKQVLVAEDVEINQFLVKHILKGWGCVVHLAPDGKKALELASNRHFDVVLMDIQMPFMDGIEATQHIRMLADKRKATVPIIALTANALKGDDVKYIAAGMSGYLTKPFSEKSLYNLLVKVMSPDTSQLTETADSSSLSPLSNTSQMATKPYDLSGLEAMSGNDPDFLPMMAKLFLDTVPGVLDKLNQAYQAGDWAAVGNLAHKLKPTIDAMNINSLTQVVRQTENHGRQGIELDTIGAKVTRINEVLLECINNLESEFSL